MMPKIKATTSSVPAFDQPLAAGSVIPDTAQVATPRAAAETRTRSRNLMDQILRELSGSGFYAVTAEKPPVGIRGGAAPGAEVMAQRGRVAEAGPVGDRVHRLVALLQQLLSQQDALPDQPALRRGAGVLHEAPGEGPLRHVRPRGQLAYGQRLVQVHAQPLEEVPQGPVTGGGDRLVDVLGLTAVAVRRYHHAPGDAVGDARALFLPDQVEARVDAGRRARAGDHRVVVDVEDVGIDLGRRVTAGEFFRV